MWINLSVDEFIPESWRTSENLNLFNPAICNHDRNLIMAYRVVVGGKARKVAICRLDGDYRPIPGSVLALSDLFEPADPDRLERGSEGWVADPRLTSFGSRLFLNYQTGPNVQNNQIALVELDPVSLRPLGPARTVHAPVLARRPVEKNWTFFESNSQLFTIYSFSPLVILSVDLSNPFQIICTPTEQTDWDDFAYSQSYGELRGGAPPIEHEGRLYFITHSVFSAEQPVGGSLDSELCYVAPVVVLESKFPFRPVFVSSRPLIESSPRELALNDGEILDLRCREVVYPCGAVSSREGILVSYGVRNSHMVLRHIAWDKIHANLMPAVPRRPACAIQDRSEVSDRSQDAPLTRAGGRESLNALWWQPQRVSPRKSGLNSLRERRFVYGNFGDLMVPHLLGRITGYKSLNRNAGPKLITIGSILTLAADGDAIWGAGLKGSAPIGKPPGDIHAFAVRGPISYDFLRRRGHDVSRVSALLDPGILTAHLFGKDIETLRSTRGGHTRRPYLIIPHLDDHMAMRAAYADHGDQIRSVDAPFFDLVMDIVESELVISSSLHGLIIAESLGIPAVWHAPMMGEDELKFTDYYLGTDRTRIVRAKTLQEALRANPMQLPKINASRLLESFPSDAVLRDLGILKGIPASVEGVRMSVGADLDPRIELLSGWGRPEKGSVWTIHSEAFLDVAVPENISGSWFVLLSLMPYMGSGEQGVTVKHNGSTNHHARFSKSGQVTITIDLKETQISDGRLRLTLVPDQIRSPLELGLGTDVRTLGVALSSIEFRSSLS